MRAVRLLAAGGAPTLVEVPLPTPVGRQVRVRVAGCGVCRTDLHVVDGIQARVDLPVTLGHEVAGWVDAVGADAVNAPPIGDAVLVHGGWGCGACRECRAGAEQRCEGSVAPGFQADGGYAEALIVPEARHLVPLGSVDPVRAAPLADAGVTPFRAVRRAERWLAPDARVLVIGCGGLGQFALQYLRLVPADGGSLHVTALDRRPSALRRATALGADRTIDDSERTATPAEIGPVDVVLDFVGDDATLALAAGTVAPDGLVVLVGEAGGSLRFGFDRVAVESWLTTVAWGSVDDLRNVVSLASTGKLDWDVETLPLERAAEAHARLRAGDVVGRLVLVP